MEKKTASAITLTLLLTGMLTLAFNIQPVKASGTVYIRADGSVEGTTYIVSYDNVTYTFTADINDSIVVERNNILVDGAGYAVIGSGSGNGITLTDRINVTVGNMTIKNFGYGIWLTSSSNNVLSGNNVTANHEIGIVLRSSSNSNTLFGNNVTSNRYDGIYLSGSSYNRISGNTITNNAYGIVLTPFFGAPDYSSSNILFGNNVTSNRYGGIWLSSSSNNTLSGNIVVNNAYGVTVGYGIWLDRSSNNVLSGNVMGGNRYNFGVDGDALSHYLHSVDASNLVDGKPVYYFMNQSDMVVSADAYPEVGYLGLVNCANVTVRGLNLTRNGQGILVAFTNGSKITGNNVTNNNHGIELGYSSNNVLSGNNVTANQWDGIWLASSSNNTLSGNNVANSYYGIWLASSSNNTLFGNNVTSNFWQYGAYLTSSSNNSITENIFVDSGLFVWGSYGNVVRDNIVNGKPLVYLEEVSSYTVKDAGQVILVRCKNITVENINLFNTNVGVELWETNNTKITNNKIANNWIDGVYLYKSSNNSITDNDITNNWRYGIYFDSSSNNSIAGNNITNKVSGICLSHSSNNRITENNITNNEWPFIGSGISLSSSSNNSIFHNNFIDNTRQIESEYSMNTWDDGYPSGGNYWSDYAGEDLYSGPYQNITGGDGIGDTPYVIDANNQDRYPLMNPYVLLGDLNNDGVVNILDMVIFGKAYGSYPGHARWNPVVDLDGNGIINILDGVRVAKNFGKTG